MEPEKILPLYFLVAFCNSRRLAYASTAGRPVSLSVVKAANAVTWAVYTPLIAISCLPTNGHAGGNPASTMWPLLPICISSLTQLLAAAPIFKNESQSEPARPGIEKAYMKPYLNQDYPLLMTLYRTLLLLSLLASFFIPSSPGSQRLMSANIIAHCLQSTFEMRRLGYVTTKQALSATLVMMLGTTLVGPVSIYIGTWQWRESVINRLSR